MADAEKQISENLKSYGWIGLIAVVTLLAIVSVGFENSENEEKPSIDQKVDINITNVSVDRQQLYFNLDSNYNKTIHMLTLCLNNDEINETCATKESYNFSAEENLSLKDFSRTDEPKNYQLNIAYNLTERIELEDEISVNAAPTKIIEPEDKMVLNETEENSDPGQRFFSGGGSGSTGDSGDDQSSSSEDEYQESYFKVNHVKHSNSVEAGDDVIIKTELENIGQERGTQSVELLVEGEREYYLPEVSLLKGEVTSENLVWPTQFDYSGTYEYTVRTENESVKGQIYVGSWEPPEATIEVNVTDPEPGQKILLDASGSEPGDGEITDYKWEVNQTERIGRTIEAEPAAGIYEIELNVTDSLGEVDTDSLTINVTE